jgi:VanZ family protein
MRKRWILVLLVLFWMTILVWFSLQPKLPIDAKEHAKWMVGQVEKRYTIDHFKRTISDKVTWLEPGFVKFYSFYGLNYNDRDSAFNFLIRKAGHFTVYFILGLLLFFTFRRFVSSPYLWTLLMGLLFALFDELNQFYLSGRTSMIQDVLVDFAGVVSSLLIIFACIGIYRGLRLLKQKMRNKLHKPHHY